MMPIRCARFARRLSLGVLVATAVAGCAGAPPTPSKPAAAQARNGQTAESLVIKAGKALVAGDVQAAAQNYVKAAEASSDPDVARQATALAYHAGDLKLATRAAKRWHALAPAAAPPRHFLAVLALRRHDLDAATAQFRALMKIGGRYDFATVAGILAAETAPYDGFEIMRRLETGNADDPEAEYALAWLAARADHTALAHAKLSQVLEARPRWLKALMLRGRLLAAAGEKHRAIEPVEKLLKTRPDDIDLKINYSELLFDAGRDAKARDILADLLASKPENPEALMLLGADSIDRDDDKHASRYFTRLLETNKRDDQAYRYLGQLAARKKDYRMALNWFQRIDHDQRRAIDVLSIASALTHVRDLATARKYLDAARRHYPQFADDLTIGEARLLVKHDDKKAAMKVMDAALQAQPQNTALLYMRGMLAEQFGRHDQAIADLRRVIQLEPDNTAGLNALGYLLTEHTRDYRQACDYISRALDFSPDNPAIIDSLGWVYFRLGRERAALQALRRAHKLTDDPEISAHLVAVLRASGEHDEARHVLTQALHKHPDAAALKRLKPKS